MDRGAWWAIVIGSQIAGCDSMSEHDHKALLESHIPTPITIESEVKVAQLCPALCDPMDCSLLGSSLHGILQTRILEWVAVSFFRGSSQPKGQT